MLPIFHVPEWLQQIVVVLIAIGFPCALMLAWAFDVTSEGIQRTSDLGRCPHLIECASNLGARHRRHFNRRPGAYWLLVLASVGAPTHYFESSERSDSREKLDQFRLRKLY